jgi:hypothetical protein
MDLTVEAISLEFQNLNISDNAVTTIRLPENLRDAWTEYWMCDRASSAGWPARYIWICH